MVLECFAASGPGCLAVIEGTMNFGLLLEILKEKHKCKKTTFRFRNGMDNVRTCMHPIKILINTAKTIDSNILLGNVKEWLSSYWMCLVVVVEGQLLFRMI